MSSSASNSKRARKTVNFISNATRRPGADFDVRS
jgi:hypothetical protein